jgi:hypothetical protein
VAKQDAAGKRRAVRAPRRTTAMSEYIGVPVILDAEDIALARLQAHLRETETIQPSPRPGGAVTRVTIRLPAPLATRLKTRARRDGVPISDLVARALDRFFRSA